MSGYISDIDAPNFYCCLNGQVQPLSWLEPVNLYNICTSSVDVGIDQSSTNTGIYLFGDGLKFMTELPRGYQTVNEYKRALRREFNVLFKHLDINHFIFEKHGRHITGLHALIDEITNEIKMYSRKVLTLNDATVKIHGVLPSVWRSGYLDRDEYSGQFKREAAKVAAYKEAIKRDPELAAFRQYSGKDLDGYEAYGIIHGYLDLNYAEDGTRIVNTTMEKRYGRKYTHIIKKIDLDNEANEIMLMQKKYKTTNVLNCNPNILLDESLNRVVGEYDKAIIRFPSHPEATRFIFETGEPLEYGQGYLVYVKKIS